jgi:hypothetical protein
MATLRRRIEVEASPSVTEATWSHFIQAVRRGQGHLSCDDLVCVDAIRTGMITFAPGDGAHTVVEFAFETDGDSQPAVEIVEQNMARDLVVFKDYVERGGSQYGKATDNELRELQGREERKRHERHQDHISKGYEDASNKADMYPA